MLKLYKKYKKIKSQFYSTSEARKILSDLVNQVKYQGKSFSIGRRGNAEAVLSPVAIGQGEAKQALDFHEHIRNVRAEKNMNDDLLSAPFKKEFKKLAKKYSLSLIILFGSQAEGRPKWHSDVDIAVVPSKNLTPKRENDLYGDLADLLGRDDIDLINLGRVYDVLLRYEIFTKGKILFQSDKEEFGRRRTRAWFEYQDFKPYLDRSDELIERKLDKLINAKI